MDLSSLNAKQKQIYEQFKDDPDFDMETALAKFQKAPTQARQIKRVKEPKESISRELRLVIEILHRRVELVQRACGECGKTFACDYLYAAFCSDQCRAANLFRLTGIIWDPDKSERERWAGEPPSIIKPETLEQLHNFAKAILAIPTADAYVGRGPDVLATSAQTTIGFVEVSKSTAVGESEASTGKVRDVPNSLQQATTRTNAGSVKAAEVMAIRSGTEAQALKEKLASGEITKLEYQLALADLF